MIEHPCSRLVVVNLHVDDKFEHVIAMIKWCEDNCADAWSHSYYTWNQHMFRFECVNDCKLFTLTWVT